MKRNLLALLACLLFAAPASAQVTITYVFVDGQTANAADVNTNFSQLSSAALNRTGGTITGNIAVSALVTIDGVDVGVQACTTCSPLFTAVTASGLITAGTFSGNGASITALNASNLSTGTVATGRISGTYANAVQFTDASNTFSGTFTGPGGALTGLNFNVSAWFQYNATPLKLQWTRSDAAKMDVLWMDGVAGASNVILEGPGALGTLALRTNGTPALSFDASQNAVFTAKVQLATVLFAALGTPTNGTLYFCSNCDPASNPCTTGGASTGSFAHRMNGTWKCN